MSDRTSTDHEIDGMNGPVSLADGHACQDLEPVFRPIVAKIQEIWEEADGTSIPAAEHLFKNKLAEVIGSDTLRRHEGFVVCPSASNSIEIAAEIAAMRGHRVGLLVPSFDNLQLLAKRRHVETVPVGERALMDAARSGNIAGLLRKRRIGALFLVNPNNPTGQTIPEDMFQEITGACADNDILLIVDCSFRLHNRRPYDDYRILVESGVSFICFEDTGKTFPTQEMKASVLSYSPDNGHDVLNVYREVYLGAPKLNLMVLLNFLDVTAKVGLEVAVWRTIDAHRTQLRAVLAGSPLRVAATSSDSTLSVEWLDCTATGRTDLEVCADLRAMGLHVLPGRNFFWDAPALPENHGFIRVSLLRKRQLFRAGLDILSRAKWDAASMAT